LEWAHQKRWISEGKNVVQDLYADYEVAANQEAEAEAEVRQEEEEVVAVSDELRQGIKREKDDIGAG
jgi:hypothetical protein